MPEAYLIESDIRRAYIDGASAKAAFLRNMVLWMREVIVPWPGC